MSWIIGTIGLFGFLLGLRYKIASLIAASAAAFLAIAGMAIHQGWSLKNVAVAISASLATMQGAYVLGLVISGWASEKRRPPPHE